MIHCRSTLEKPRACCADGSAMFMIVMSRTIISWASPMSARISQRRRPGPSGVVTGPPATSGALDEAISFSRLERPCPFLPPTVTEVERYSPLGYDGRHGQRHWAHGPGHWAHGPGHWAHGPAVAQGCGA